MKVGALELEDPGPDPCGALAAVGRGARTSTTVTCPSSSAAGTSDVEAIARLITTFLELHRLESPAEPSQSSDSEADILGDHS